MEAMQERHREELSGLPLSYSPLGNPKETQMARELGAQAEVTLLKNQQGETEEGTVGTELWGSRLRSRAPPYSAGRALGQQPHLKEMRHKSAEEEQVCHTENKGPEREQTGHS